MDGDGDSGSVGLRANITHVVLCCVVVKCGHFTPDAASWFLD